MRSLLLPLSLLFAVATTVGVALLVLRDSPAPAGPAQAAQQSRPGTPPQRPSKPLLRPYQTTLTLAEDLRDALGSEPAALDAEVWRVSKAIESKATWTLVNLAEQEASPRVRALLVLAAGVHTPESDILHRFLNDRESVVRHAAVLAIGYRADGSERGSLLGGVSVPLGRATSPRLQRMLEICQGKEKADEVRVAIASVLSSRR